MGVWKEGVVIYWDDKDYRRSRFRMGGVGYGKFERFVRYLYKVVSR